MKRVANNVALQTALYVVSGNQKVRICDWKTAAYVRENEKSKPSDVDIVFDGLLKDWKRGYAETKYERCALRGIRADGDTLVFDLNTTFEALEEWHRNNDF